MRVHSIPITITDWTNEETAARVTDHPDLSPDRSPVLVVAGQVLDPLDVTQRQIRLVEASQAARRALSRSLYLFPAEKTAGSEKPTT